MVTMTLPLSLTSMYSLFVTNKREIAQDLVDLLTAKVNSIAMILQRNIKAPVFGCITPYTTGVSAHLVAVLMVSCSSMNSAKGGEIA